MKAANSTRMRGIGGKNQSSTFKVPYKESTRRAARDEERLAIGAVSKRMARTQCVLKFEQSLIAAYVLNYYTPVAATDGNDVRGHRASDATDTRLHWRKPVDHFAGVDIYENKST